MEDLNIYGWPGIKQFLKKNHVPILYTVILHLVVAIILVLLKVEGLKKDQELGIKLEFEEKSIEEILAEEEVEIPAQWLEALMQEREAASNRAVNLNAENEFDRDISTDEYVRDLLGQIEEARNQDDRERLEELQAILATADYVPPEEMDNSGEQAEYTGPTNITYAFKEEPLSRGKIKLTIPVYRCEGAGRVLVEVLVGRDGTVLDATVLDPVEGADKVCFTRVAREAALTSRFRVELNAPERHRAVISYTFIAQ